MNRREFVSMGSGAAALAAAGLARAQEAAPAEASATPPTAEPVRIAVIGTGQRGRALIGHFSGNPGARIAAICEVNRDMLLKARQLVGAAVPAEENYKKILERSDIDAVAIATPDHWHAILAIEACKAGKDVYLEKPMSFSVEEGRRIVDAAAKHGRVVQVGTQQVSGEHYKKAAEAVKGGRLGKVFMVRTWFFRNRLPGYGFPPETTPPPSINWDLWVGPRAMTKYSALKAVSHWRSFEGFSGGMIADWGAHHFHSVMEMMGYAAPKSVTSIGGRYAIKDAATVPDTSTTVFEFDGWTLEFMHLDASSLKPHNCLYGIELRGTQGTIFINRRGYKFFGEKGHGPDEVVGEPDKEELQPVGIELAHVQDFLDCVRSRAIPASPPENAHKATTLCHLGKIALAVGRRIQWDGEKEMIVGDEEANAMLKASYRAPYLLPEV